MKDQNELKGFIVHKCNYYEFFIEGVECTIMESNNTFYSYIKGKWLENKDDKVEEAIDIILRHIGIRKDVRDSLKIKIVDTNGSKEKEL